MKKSLIAIGIFALALNASALSFQWAATGVAFDGATLKNSTAITGSLIYLGNGGSLDENYSLGSCTTGEDVAKSIGAVVDTKNKTSAVGKIQNTYTFDFGSEPGKNGDVFALLLEYKTSEKTYVNLASTTMTLSGLEDDTSSISNPTFSLSYGSSSESSKVSGGGGWVAVPEPSTAALALAGLALLLKRRKA